MSHNHTFGIFSSSSSVMKRICAWCRVNLGNNPSSSDDLITHGICDTCAGHLISQMGTPLQKFLDGLGVPVLVVDGEGTVKTANANARETLGKELSAIEGYPGGNVIECVNASLPAGCGNTIHCKACTIRQTVMETYATGKGRSRVPAYPDIHTSSGPRRLSFQISTEKVQDVVLLRLDDIADDD